MGDSDRTLLVKSSRNGDLRTVENLLKRSIPRTDSHIVTVALIQAARFNHLPIVQTLLNRRVNINMNDSEALYRAIRNSNLPMVELLLDRGANINPPNRSLLSEAAAQGNLPMVKYLYNHGAGNKQEALNMAITLNDLPVIDFIASTGLTADEMRDALYLALLLGVNVGIVELLVDYGGNLQQFSSNLLRPYRHLIPKIVTGDMYSHLEPLIKEIRERPDRWLITDIFGTKYVMLK